MLVVPYIFIFLVGSSSSRGSAIVGSITALDIKQAYIDATIQYIEVLNALIILINLQQQLNAIIVLYFCQYIAKAEEDREEEEGGGDREEVKGREIARQGPRGGVYQCHFMAFFPALFIQFYFSKLRVPPRGILLLCLIYYISMTSYANLYYIVFQCRQGPIYPLVGRLVPPWYYPAIASSLPTILVLITILVRTRVGGQYP